MYTYMNNMLTWYDMISWYYMIWHAIQWIESNWQHTIQQLYPAIALYMHSSCRTSYLLRTCIIYYYHMCNYKQCSTKTHAGLGICGIIEGIFPANHKCPAFFGLHRGFRFGGIGGVSRDFHLTRRASGFGSSSWAREGSWRNRSKDTLLLKTVESSTRKNISEDKYIDYRQYRVDANSKNYRIMNSQDHS